MPPFDILLHNATQSPLRLDYTAAELVAVGGTASVFRICLDGRDTAVKRIENVLDIQHAPPSTSTVKVNLKRVIDAEVALHLRITELGIRAAPVFYGVIRLAHAPLRYTYFLFMQYMPAPTLRQFLHTTRGVLEQPLANALLTALRHTCDEFARHGILLDDRSPANVLVLEPPASPSLRVLFLDFQHHRWHSGPVPDMFARPAWLICVAAAYAEHVRNTTDKNTTQTHAKGGAVLQRAQRILGSLDAPTSCSGTAPAAPTPRPRARSVPNRSCRIEHRQSQSTS
jgi:hypothetical protein